MHVLLHVQIDLPTTKVNRGYFVSRIFVRKNEGGQPAQIEYNIDSSLRL